ncbi:MAG: hypothetical protein IJM18_05240 [Clostridia bacterium]|nr:hypothetical protein [Clostridia bacterium]
MNHETRGAQKMGAALSASRNNEQSVFGGKVPASHKGNRAIGYTFILLGVLISLAFILVPIALKSWRVIATGAVKNAFKGNIEKVFEYLPNSYVRDLAQDADLSVYEYKKEVKNQAVDYREQALPDGLRLVDVEILDSVELDDSVVLDIAAAYNLEGVLAGKTVTIEATCEKDGVLETRVVTLDVLKIGSSWYISPEGYAALASTF